MDIQKRKMDLEGELNQVRQNITRLEGMLREASIVEQRMIGALALCDEILKPETAPVAAPVVPPDLETPQ